MAEISRIGVRLKALRERQGFTQHELAKRSGVSRATIAHTETGTRRNLSVESAARLANALGVSLDMLVHGDILDEDEAYSQKTTTMT